MATGRIGVTPTLGVRWSKAPAGGTTSLSGLDDNSVSLVYSVGYEQVYRNGVLLSRTNDYTATNGTTITLVDATIAGDIIEVFANELVPLTDAISKGQFNSKGALLSATAASTPGVLAVGANDTVLTADSSTSTGLKWAAPAAGGMTLLSTTTLSGASTTISGINQTYNNLYILITGVTNATSSGRFWCKLNDTNNNAWTAVESGSIVSGTSDLRLSGGNTVTRTDANNAWALNVYNYTSTDTYKPFQWSGYWQLTGGSQYIMGGGGYYNNSAISSILFASEGGNLSTGTVKIYGVK